MRQGLRVRLNQKFAGAGAKMGNDRNLGRIVLAGWLSRRPPASRLGASSLKDALVARSRNGFGLSMVVLSLFVGITFQPVLSSAASTTTSNETVQVQSSDVSVRREWDLGQEGRGRWSFQDPSTAEWMPARVPGSNEENVSQNDFDFDGRLVYRLRLSPRELPGFSGSSDQRTFLHFNAVASRCTVDWVSPEGDLNRLGEHLGGWTPFQIDLTKICQRPDLEDVELLISVDELVGHNTQGFLPIIEPHFGGIWQSVSLRQTPAVGIDGLKACVQGVIDGDTADWVIEVPVRGTKNDLNGLRLEFRYRRAGSIEWSPVESLNLLRTQQDDRWFVGTLERRLARNVEPWRPDNPVLYEYEIRLVKQLGESEDLLLDRISGRTGFRSYRVVGQRILVDSQPLQIRGVLNWGFDPNRLGPTTSEKQMREELELARDWGFNLMKFCLWVPPPRYFELADEMGMLVWVEYPTWHPKLDREHEADLLREYEELFRRDRQHPSVVLRSLTCETGPSADLGVLKSLYTLGKRLIPGAIIEDDSSWIEWNRIHDFYDDHPYGNNHTWPATVARLKSHIAEREAKPLVLGEAIAADTWFDPWRESGDARSLLGPGFSDGNRAWLSRMEPVIGRHAARQLTRESLRYAWLMRKFQIEHFRHAAPDAGYVVSVIRDFPLAGMGLFDYSGKPKWPAALWGWHRGCMLTMQTERNHRSLKGGGEFRPEISIHNRSFESLSDLSLVVEWETGARPHSERVPLEPIPPGDSLEAIELALKVPRVDEPKSARLRVRLEGTIDGVAQQVISVNGWQLWVVPDSVQVDQLCFHESYVSKSREDAEAFKPTGDDDSRIVVTRRLDEPLLNHLESGGSVVLLADGSAGSFATQSHWFLRGGPVVTDSVSLPVPRDLWVELQHFDLAGDVIADWTDWEAIEPWLLLWDNHDRRDVLTHALLFSMPVGRGKLVVSSLNHEPPANAAGEWLLNEIVGTLSRTNSSEKSSTTKGNSNLNRLRKELGQQELSLVDAWWRFRPVPKNDPVSENWASSEFDDGGWEQIRVGQPWDAQGFAALDGWGWYRLKVRIPDDWKAKQTFLTFRGVDDHYLAYVDGKLIGQGGDPETRTTAFDTPASHEVTDWIKPGRTITIAIAVEDWQGSGGIFRPVSLTSHPVSNDRLWLK